MLSDILRWRRWPSRVASIAGSAFDVTAGGGFGDESIDVRIRLLAMFSLSHRICVGNAHPSPQETRRAVFLGHFPASGEYHLAYGFSHEMKCFPWWACSGRGYAK